MIEQYNDKTNNRTIFANPRLHPTQATPILLDGIVRVVEDGPQTQCSEAKVGSVQLVSWQNGIILRSIAELVNAIIRSREDDYKNGKHVL